MDQTWNRGATRRNEATMPSSAESPALLPAGTTGATLVDRAGGAIEELGRKLRAASSDHGMAYGETVGDALEDAGQYLRRRQLAGVRDDAERLVIERPVTALLIAAAVGYLAGRLVRR